ncbi:MAG: Ig-like domain-containing protein, partial [Planctomycetaceae bacterium]
AVLGDTESAATIILSGPTDVGRIETSRNFLVSGGTLTGTVLTTIDGATLQVAGNVTLDAVTLNTDLDLGGQSISVLNGLTLNRTLGMSNDSAVYFSGGSQTLAGTGTVDFRGGYRQALVANADNATLTIGSGITVRGGNGYIGDDYNGSLIGYSRWAGGGNNVSVVNLGTITADSGGRGIFINPRGSGTFATSGTLHAKSGGTLHLGGGTTMTAGTIAVARDSSVVVLGNHVQSGGLIDLAGGTFDPTGSVTIAAGAISGQGTIKADVTNSGTITPGGAAAGTVRIEGNYTQTAAGGLAIGIGGTATKAYDKLDVTGTAALDGLIAVSMIDGYRLPSSGIVFEVLSSSLLGGAFAATAGLDQGDGRTLGVSYGAWAASLVSAVTTAAGPVVTSFSPSGVLYAAVATMRVVFNEPVDLASFTAADVTITTPAGVVDRSQITVTPVSATEFDIEVPALAIDGDYTVAIGPGVADPGGNAMDAAFTASFTVNLAGPRIAVWDGGSDGSGTNFLNAANWEGDVLPGPGDTVLIGDTGSTSTITISGTVAVGQIRTSRNVVLQNATVTGTTITVSGDASVSISSNGVTLDGVTLNGNLSLGEQWVTVLGGLVLNGTLSLNYGSRVYFGGGSQALAGNGTVVFNNATRQGLIANAEGMTLTIGAGITIRGGNSSVLNAYEGSVIGYSDWAGGANHTSIFNLGTIAANAAGRGLFINPRGAGSFTNAGATRVENGGTLAINGATGDMASIVVAGASTLWLNGTYTLGSRITVPAGQSITYNGAWSTATGFAVTGGSLALGGSWTATDTSIDVTAGSLVFTSSGATLDRVTYNGNLSLGEQWVTVLGGLVLNGTLSLNYGSRVYFGGGSQTLAGNGTVVFNNATRQALIANAEGMTLTIGAGITIRGGNSSVLNAYEGSAIGYSDWAGGANHTSAVNLGTIAANAAGRGLFINPRGAGSFTNAGAITAEKRGTVAVGGGGMTNTGAITQALKSTFACLGTYTQTAGSLALAGGIFDPAGTMSITGGTVTATGTIRADVVNGGVLRIGEPGTIGTLRITGTYTQTASGVVNVDIGATAQPTWNMASDFSTASNPNGVWTYGWQSSTDPTVDGFEAFTRAGSREWSRPSGDAPVIWFNDGGPAHGVPSGSMCLHPGPSSEPAIARWTAPFSGAFTFEGSFGAGDSAVLDAYVRVNGTPIWETIDFSSDKPFSITRTLAAGDRVDWLVTGGYAYGSTPLSVKVTGTPSSLYPINDRLVVSSAAALDGRLNLGVVGGYQVPTSGIEFPVIRFASHSGTFAATAGLDQGNGRTFALDYRATSATLVSDVNDTAGPVALTMTPSGALSVSVSTLRIEFNEPVDAATFTAADVVVTTPTGTVHAGLIAITQVSASEFDITLPTLSADGDYAVTIGPGISDTIGNPMDGAFTASFAIDRTGPRVLSVSPAGGVSPPLTTFDISFDAPIAPASLTVADVSLAGPAGAAIAPSSITAVSSTVYRLTFPAQTQPGDYTLAIGPDVRDAAGNAMDQDGDGVNGEATEDVFTATVTLQAVDITVTDLTVVEPSPQSGGTLTIRWNDTNAGTGTLTGSWVDRIRVVNTTTGATLVDTTLAAAGPLAGAAALDREYTLTLPHGTAGTGTLSIEITADAAGAVDESNVAGTGESNNVASVTVASALAPYPDLHVTGLEVVESALQSGGGITIRWHDSNTGTAAATGYGDRIRVVNTTTGATLLDTTIAVPGSVGAGGSLAREYGFTLPHGSDGAGTLSIEITADAGGDLYEANASDTGEDNNSASISVVSALAPYPNLRVTDLAVAEASLESGGTLTIRWLDSNTGTADAPGGWSDRIRVVNTTTGTTILDVPLLQASTIAAGASLAREYAFLLPDGDAGAGSLSIEITADTGNTLFEHAGDGSGESDNAATITAIAALAPYPDLRVTGLEVVETSLQSGGAVTIRWNDVNTGVASAAGGWVDRVRIVNTTTGATLLDATLWNGLAVAAGGTLAREYAFTLPDGSPGVGELSIEVTADATGSRFEHAADGTGESNNSATITRSSTLAPYADLAVSAVTAPATALPGTAVTVTWTVSNVGD